MRSGPAVNDAGRLDDAVEERMRAAPCSTRGILRESARTRIGLQLRNAGRNLELGFTMWCRFEKASFAVVEPVDTRSACIREARCRRPCSHFVERDARRMASLHLVEAEGFLEAEFSAESRCFSRPRCTIHRNFFDLNASRCSRNAPPSIASIASRRSRAGHDHRSARWGDFVIARAAPCPPSWASSGR